MRAFSIILLICLWGLTVACAPDATPTATPRSRRPTTPTPPSANAEQTPIATLTEVAATATPPPPPPQGALVASAFRNGRWDLYLLSVQGQLQRRLTFGNGVYRAPSWSPDGARIAYEARLDDNWDVYVMDADGGNMRRLTTEATFDGSPRWSPNGSQIAFVSSRASNLDIWVMGADGLNPINLTPKTDEHDFDPTWSPDGKQIAFTSLRDGNKEIYVMNADGSGVRNLTQSKTIDEEHPAWSPDGKRIVFVTEQRAQGPRELNILEVANPQQRLRTTALQYHQWPVWSPDGAELLFVAQNEDRQALERIAIGQSYVTTLTQDRVWYRQPDWSARATPVFDAASLAQGDEPLFVEKTTPNPPNRADRYNLVKVGLPKMKTPDYLADTVDDSFRAMRERVLTEAGWDFLGNLSEAARPLDFKSGESDFLSWHKAGRAIDTVWDLLNEDGRAMEFAREDVLGKTYWRMYLRTTKQNGSQGEPLRETLWDISTPTRQRVFPRGGVVKGVPGGYYVDVTEIMRQYGWRRIESQPNWARDFYALEYWHYEKTDGLKWWDAVHEIYTPPEIGKLFSYDILRRQRYDLATLVDKGVPVPPEVLQKLQTVTP